MKKLFLLALTCICCLALTIPAMGGVKVNGMITMDWNYIDRDEARAAGGFIAPGVVNYDNGLEQMNFEFPMPLTFLQVSYTSKDKVVSGLMRWRLGSGGALGGTGLLNLYYAYINYAFSDRFSMRFGRQNTVLSPMSPSQLSGFDSWGHIVGIGHGNQNHTSLLDGIVATIKMSPMISLKVGIFDNDTDTAEAVVTAAGTLAPVPAAALREENTLPRFDVAIPITIANFKIIPSFSYLKQEYDQVAPGNDTDVDVWAGALSARAGFGPFSITGEITFGENMGVGNYNASPTYLAFTGLGTGIGGPKNYADAAGFNRIAEEDNVLWFVDLAFKFGPATLHGIYGQSNAECEGSPLIGSPGDPAEFDITSQMYGFSLPISIGSGFTIRPELFFYDYDDDALWGGAQNLDMGEETILSVLFQLYF